MEFLELLVVLVLAALAAYVLAILLRISCHLCGVEIPALGRAYFTAAATAGLTVLTCYAILAFLFRADSTRLRLPVTGGVLALASAVISTILYMPLLDVRFRKSFSIWLMQALVFIALGLLAGCFFGVMSLF